MQIPKSWIAYVAFAAAVMATMAISILSLMGASAINDATDAQSVASALNTAGGDMQNAWTGVLHADALAATGASMPEAQARFDSAQADFTASVATYRAANSESLAPVLDALEQGFAGVSASFATTYQLASDGDVQAAAANHVDSTIPIVAASMQAVDGLGLAAQSADAAIADELNSGASVLRSVSIVGIAVASVSFAVLATAIAFGWWWKVPEEPPQQQRYDEDDSDYEVSRAA